MTQPSSDVADATAAPIRVAAPTRHRLHELDALRVFAFGLLILFHVGLFYAPGYWPVNSPRPIPMVGELVSWSSPWRMSLLFLIAGAALGLTTRRGIEGIAARRTWRLLLPLAFGIVVVLPPQAYLEVVEHLGWSGGYLEFLTIYARSYPTFCTLSDCGKSLAWHHLWFLPYVWVYTMLALVLLRVAAWHRHPQWALLSAGTRLLWAPWLVLVALRLTLAEQHPITLNLIDDSYNHALSLSMFLLGLALFGHADDRHGAWEAARRLRWLSLGLTLVAMLAFQFLQSEHGGPILPSDEWGPLPLLAAARQWLPVVAAVGWARQCLTDWDSPTQRWLTRAVFPCYVVHQTVIVIAAHALAPLGWPQALEAALLITITTVCCLATAALAMRVSWLGPLLGVDPSAPARRRAATVVVPS